MSDQSSKDNRNPEEIQRDIEQTQSKLAEDLDELSHRASPEGLKDQATGQLESLKSAAVHATEEAANEVTHRAEALGEEFAGRLRDNPLPAALVGAAVGVGWLLMRAAQDNEPHPPHAAGTVRTDTAAVTTYAGGEAARQREQDGYDAGRSPDTRTLLVGGAVLLGGAALGLFLPRRRDSSRPYGTGQPSRVTYDFSADDAHYRRHYEETFAHDDRDYEHFEPAYRFGTDLAEHPTYRSRDWAGTRPDAQGDWEQRNDTSWEEVRDAVRYGWERARGYRAGSV